MYNHVIAAGALRNVQSFPPNSSSWLSWPVLISPVSSRPQQPSHVPEAIQQAGWVVVEELRTGRPLQLRQACKIIPVHGTMYARRHVLHAVDMGVLGGFRVLI